MPPFPVEEGGENSIPRETSSVIETDKAFSDPLALINLKILCLLAIFIVGILGGYVPFRMKLNSRLVSIGNAFSGGIFLTVGFVHMLGETVEDFELLIHNGQLSKWTHDLPLPYMLCICGILITFYLEKVAMVTQHQHPHCDIPSFTVPLRNRVQSRKKKCSRLRHRPHPFYEQQQQQETPHLLTAINLSNSINGGEINRNYENASINSNCNNDNDRYRHLDSGNNGPQSRNSSDRDRNNNNYIGSKNPSSSFPLTSSHLISSSPSLNIASFSTTVSSCSSSLSGISESISGDTSKSLHSGVQNTIGLMNTNGQLESIRSNRRIVHSVTDSSDESDSDIIDDNDDENNVALVSKVYNCEEPLEKEKANRTGKPVLSTGSTDHATDEGLLLRHASSSTSTFGSCGSNSNNRDSMNTSNSSTQSPFHLCNSIEMNSVLAVDSSLASHDLIETEENELGGHSSEIASDLILHHPIGTSSSVSSAASMSSTSSAAATSSSGLNWKSQRAQMYMIGWILSVHSLIEGIALGIEKSQSAVVSIFIAILSHKFFDTFAFGMSLVKANSLSNRDSLKAIILFSLGTPLGIVLGLGALQNPANSTLAMLIKGLSSGTFIYIALVEVILEEFQRPNDRHMKFAVLLFSAIVMCLFTGGHGEPFSPNENSSFHIDHSLPVKDFSTFGVQSLDKNVNSLS